jgi:hypothetical protein
MHCGNMESVIGHLLDAEFSEFSLSMEYIILSRVRVVLDGVLYLILDLLTTLTHNSQLHLIMAPSLISTLYRSLQHALSLLQPAVSSLDNDYSSASVLRSSLNGGSFPAELFLLQLASL